jgi:hypothetical protein
MACFFLCEWRSPTKFLPSSHRRWLANNECSPTKWPARIFLFMVRGIERTATDWVEILTRMGFLSNSMTTPQSDLHKLLQNSIRDLEARLNSGYFLLRSRKLLGLIPQNLCYEVVGNKCRRKTEVQTDQCLEILSAPGQKMQILSGLNRMDFRFSCKFQESRKHWRFCGWIYWASSHEGGTDK